MRKIVWLSVFVLLAGCGGIAFWRWRATHKKPDVVYTSAPAEKRHIVGKVTASGTLSALVTVQVGSQVSGRIGHLYADYNSHVKKGELVAKIDPQLFQANVDQANASYLAARASLAKAKAVALIADKQLARAKALREQNLAAQADVDTAEGAAASAHADIDVSTANLAQANANLSQSQVSLSYTNIVSPIDGVVISRSVDVGQTVAASLSAPTIFTIAEDLRKMQVDTNVSEGDVGRLKEGMSAYFAVDAFPGQRFKGKVREIRNAAQTVQNVVTYDAVINVDNEDLRLRPSMTANVTIIWDEKKDALSVPNAALRFHPPNLAPDPSASHQRGQASQGQAAQGGPGGQGRKRQRGEESDTRTVYVMHGEAPTAITVKVGLTDGSYTEVTDGELAEGDEVATDATGPEGDAPAPATTSRSTGGPRMF